MPESYTKAAQHPCVCALMEAVHTVSGMNYKRDPLLVPESLRHFSHEYKGPADRFDSYWLVLHPV